jgi:CO/xanthine dehydrogenase Mo-binding subunit
MAGWPAVERAALVLRADRSDRPFLGISLYGLPLESQPLCIVDGMRLAQDRIRLPYAETPPTGRPRGILVGYGQVPVYAGQPVAILLFRDAASLREARRFIRFNPQVLRWGEPTLPYPPAPPYDPPTYLTRYAPGGAEQFSQVRDGVSDPYAPNDPKHPGNEDAARYRETIAQELADSDWSTFSSQTATQRLDPLFMEPEAGLAWLDGATRTLHCVLGTQATNGDVQDGVFLFQDPACPVKVDTVRLTSCYPGGGFGGRDESPFSSLLFLAAAYADGPVRLAYDRYEQFQAGLKRAGANMSQTLAVDGNGDFQALLADYRFEAGGKNNYSQFVAELGGYCAGGAYRWPRVSVDSLAEPTSAVVAGSMRGFGGPAATFSLETLIDRAAQHLKRDAIALRRQNALAEGDHTITGAPLTEVMRIVEICDLAAAHPLWTGREAPTAAPGLLRGVGFALANQAYGTGSDGVMAAVTLEADGNLVVHSNCVDMGNGSATTLALGTAETLGRNADQVRLGDVDAFRLLQEHFDPPSRDHTKKHVRERLAMAADADSDPWQDPDYTKSFSMSSSACLTAFHQVHAVREASRVLFDAALWPVACRLWGGDEKDAGLRAGARWNGDGLVAEGLPPIDLTRLAREAWDAGLATGAMIHAYFAGDWVSAAYPVAGVLSRRPIDGLALRRAEHGWAWMPRQDTQAPPAGADRYGRSLYAPSATLAAVLVDPASGRVRVTDVHSWLDAGPVLQPDLLAGQYQGAVAMGIGATLLESLPLGPGGPGEGNWNLDRYHPALAGDVPIDAVTLDVLPPLTPDAPSKGIAEAVLCPLAPAIANAVAAATDRRFDTLPITRDQIREALKHA